MKRLLLTALALASLAGCRTRPCKSGTVYLDVLFTGSAAQANAVTLNLVLDGGSTNTQTLDHTVDNTSTSIELDFPGGYPKDGAQLAISATAFVGTLEVGGAMQVLTLSSGCTNATLTIGGDTDLAGIDLAGVMPPDLGLAGKGTGCGGATICQSGLTCVDGVCCSTACTDQCAACDVMGSVGDCVPVSGAPHGGRVACLGTDAPCAGSCDGTDTTQCHYSTDVCGVAASCTSGVATPVGACSMGVCAQATMNCPDKLCGATACQGVVQVGAGFDFGCALLVDGTVRCWGWNKWGQLGLGTSDNAMSHAPAPVMGLSGITSIAVGTNHACAIKADKTLVCWGANYTGQLGRGEAGTNDQTAHPTPQAVCATGTGGTCVTFGAAVKVVASEEDTCAIAFTNVGGATGNHVYCWGSGGDGELGNATNTAQSNSPVSVCTPTGCANGALLNFNGGIVDIALGYYHVCALDGSGNVYCWGRNDSGQIGQPLTTASGNLPVAVAGITVGAQKPIKLGAGGYISFAVISDGVMVNNLVRAWGYGNQGARGNDTSGSSANGPGPVSVCTVSGCATLLTGATDVAGSNDAACAVANGAVHCWGVNSSGELGNGTVTAVAPVFVTIAKPSLITSGAVHVASSGDSNTMCAVLGSGGVSRCWGSDKYGQVGDAGGTGSAPNPIGTPTAQKW